jgi:MtrB/PioB family decaheme-associated outer membrane protein
MNAILAVLLLVPAVRATEATVSFDLGGQAVMGNTDSSKFQEYVDVPEGVYVDNICVETTTGSFFTRLSVSKPSLKDQHADFEFGDWGRHRAYVSYDETPHNLSNTARSFLINEGQGRYTLPDGLQTDIQTAAGNAGLFIPWSPGVPLRVDRKTGKIGYEYNPAGLWRAKMDYGVEKRDGQKIYGVSFGHGQLQEVLEPIDYYTHTASFGLERAGENDGWAFRYDMQAFENNINNLSVDNFARLTDSAITGAGASSPGQAQVALPPDNMSHQVSVAYTGKLMERTRLDVTAAYGYLTQNAAFLPLTSNKLILADPRLPKPTEGSLHGEIETWNLAGKWNWKISDDLQVNLKGRHYDLNNRTPRIVLAQYVPYDGTFSPTDPTAASNPTRRRGSMPLDYAKSNLGADVYYAISKSLSFRTGYDWEHYKRHHREVADQHEHTMSASFAFKPSPVFEFRPSYSYSRRFIGEYNHEAVAEEMYPLGEGTSLGLMEEARRFDMAARTRHKGSVKIDVSPTDFWNVGVDYGLVEDDYEADYGVTAARTHYYTFDTSVGIGDFGSVYMDYSWEMALQNMRNRYRATGLDLYANDWIGYLKDTSQTFNVGTNWRLIPERLDLGLDYSLTFSKGRQENRNPSKLAGTGAQQASAAAVNLPNTYSRLQRLAAALNFKWTEHIKTLTGYEFQKYRETDWAQDGLDPFEPAWSTSVFLGATQPSYEAHIARLGFSYEF